MRDILDRAGLSDMRYARITDLTRKNEYFKAMNRVMKNENKTRQIEYGFYKLKNDFSDGVALFTIDHQPLVPVFVIAFLPG